MTAIRLPPFRLFVDWMPLFKTAREFSLLSVYSSANVSLSKQSLKLSEVLFLHVRLRNLKSYKRYLWNVAIYQLLLITNRKSHTGFRLIPTSMTLNDLERRNSPYFAFFSPNSIASLANYVTLVKDRPIMFGKYCLSVPGNLFLIFNPLNAFRVSASAYLALQSTPPSPAVPSGFAPAYT